MQPSRRTDAGARREPGGCMDWKMWGLGVVALVAVACGDDDTFCEPGRSAACFCADGTVGSAVCDPTGSFYGVCSCGGGGDAGVPTSDAGPGSCDVTVEPEGNFFIDSCGGADLCACDVVGCDTPSCSICQSPGACEPALPRRVRIAPIQAQVPTTTPSGDSWDVGGGAPDLYATIRVDDVVVLDRTATGMDSFGVEWTGAWGDANVISGSQIQIDVLDADDLDADDPAFNCVFPVTPELLRFRVLVCEDPTIGAFLGTVLPL